MMMSRYNKVMKFDEKVMQFEFEKAERMLKRADKLMRKFKNKGGESGVVQGRQ